MKVVFIEPRSTEANVYSKVSMPLLGPVYLGTILKNKGHRVAIYNEDIQAPDYENLDADLVAISILTSTARRGYEIAKKFPREKVIIGGVHASLMPREALEFARQVVAGEAEEVIADVVEGRRPEPVVQGRPVQNLDTLPNPDFSLIRGFKSPAVVMPISTSRGCPFDCSFCSVTKMFGRKYRFRSPESIVNEIKSRNAKSFFFCDDNFTAHPRRAQFLVNLLSKNKMVDWACQVRCDAAKNKELLNSMARAGCKAVCVGFESVNPMTLKAYQKDQSIEEITEAIRSFHKRKIQVHGMFVLGGEDDNKKTVRQTLRFAIKQRIDTIQMSILTPFPGTKVYEDLHAQKRIFTRDWNLYDGQHTVFNPKLLSAKELQMSVIRAYVNFYSLYRLSFLVLKLRFRNAMFRFMGYVVVKEWIRRNRKMRWLPSASS